MTVINVKFFLSFRDVEVADSFIDSSLILNVKGESITGRNRSGDHDSLSLSRERHGR